MMNLEEMTEEELLVELQKIDSEREELSEKLKQMESVIEETDIQNSKYYWELENMRSRIHSDSRALLELNEERQNLLNLLKKSHMEIGDEIKEFRKKKELEWSMKEEDIEVLLSKWQSEE